MGQRTIDTVLKLSGESEYKSALKSCASELKLLKSDLDATTSEFRNNANSMEALTAKGEILGQMYAKQQEKVSLLAGALENAKKHRDAEEQQVADLKAQYEQAKKALAEYGDEVDKNSQEYQEAQKNVDQLRDAVIKHQAMLDASTASVEKYSTQLNRAHIELDKLDDKVEENRKLLNEARDSADGCATSIDRYGDKVLEAAENTEKSTSAVEAMASAMVSSGIQQAVENVASGLKECSDASQDYEHAIKQVTTVADMAVLSQEELHSGILELSTDVKRSAEEVAEATYDALSSGIETANVLDFTRQSAQLATAGFTDMSTSVDVLTTILNAYKLESTETESVASKLVKTQDLGKVTVDQLGSVIGRVIPTAAAYGVNLDNVTAAYANMTAAGINAENTTTYLGSMMDELANSGSNVAAILKEQTGKTFGQLMGEGKSLGDVLEILGATVNYDNEQFSNLWSSSTACKAAISLFDGSADAFNATLMDMANSSGTVAKNFNTMTEASETASSRLEVASENLKIAVGDQLNPVLDELRNAAAGVLEQATEIVQENPAMISVITGTVTALGLLASGVSALMAVKSVSAAFEALNIVLAANPFTIVAVAVTALVSALATYEAQTTSAREQVDLMTESARTLAETVSNGNSVYDNTVASVDASSATVARYIERLKELERQGLTTKEQQLEYSMTLEKINSLMPGLNAELNEQTGLVKGGTSALAAQAEQWKKAALVEAAYTRYKDDVAALADAEYELAKNQALLNMAREEASEINRRMSDVENELEHNLLQQSQLMADSTLSAEEYATQLGKLQNTQALLEGQLIDLEVELSANEESQLRLTEAVDESQKTIDANTTLVEAATEAYSDLADQSEDTADAVSDGASDMASAVSEATQEIIAAYNDAKVSSRESIDNQIGLFDDLSGKCELSTREMIDNLKSQQTAFENYADNITLAMERGIDIGLVQKLSDGTVESMQTLAKLVTATDEEIAELNAAFSGVENAKTYLSEAMAAVSEEFLGYLVEIGKLTEEEAYELGQQWVNGWITGVKSKKAECLSTVEDLARSGNFKFQEVHMINSPSKLYEQFAEYDVDGLIIGYKKSKPRFEKATAELAAAGYVSMIHAKQLAVPSMASAAVSAPSRGDSRLYSLLQQLLAAVREGKVLALDGKTWVGSTANAYDAKFGQMKILTDRGAT